MGTTQQDSDMVPTVRYNLKNSNRGRRKNVILIYPLCSQAGGRPDITIERGYKL